MSGSNTTSSFGSRTLGGGSSSNRTGRSAGASNPLTGQNTGGDLGTGAPSGERFVRGNRNGAFVGADSSEASNSYSGMAGGAGGRGGMGAMGGMGGLGGGMMGNAMMMNALRQGQRQSQTGNQRQNGKTTLRTPFTVAFDAPAVAPAVVSTRLQTRFANLPALKGRGSIEPVMEGDVVVLRGQVASAADRKLAEDLLSLEPGVGQVRNELVIAQSAIDNSSSPASAAPSVPRTATGPLER
jgi:osmotically-inducible protein OsmY